MLGLCCLEGYSPLAVCRLLTEVPLVAEHRLYGVQGLQHLQTVGSEVVLHGLGCSVAFFSRLGFKPVSPAWAGGFFTTEAPGKPRNYTEEEKKKRTESYLAGTTVTIADNGWVPHGGQNAVTRGVNTPPRRAQVSLARQGGVLTWRTDSGCGELVGR